jgi:hypothetical protein
MELKLKTKRLVDQPTYKEAAQELEKLHAALVKIQTRIAEIDGEVVRRGSPAAADSNHVAAALAFAETGVVAVPRAEVAGLHEERSMLAQQAEAVRSAIAVRSEACNTLVAELGAQACREAESAHNDLCVRYLQALRALDALHEEEVQFHRAIESLGYSASFRTPVQWYQVGRISDGTSLMATQVREFQAYGR